MSPIFPHFTLRGGHREVGRQHGEALRSLIRPHSICAHPGERVAYSFASLSADLDAGREIAVGPPCEHEYATYSLEAGR